MPAPAVDDQRVRWSEPEATRATALQGRPLLVMLHGYGSNADDLFGLVRYVPQEFVVASIEGLEAAGPGWAWFPLGVDPETGNLTRDMRQVDAAAESLMAWVNTLRAAHPAIPGIHLLGFSQGGAMSIELLRRGPRDFASGTVLAGFALPADTAEATARDATLADIRPAVFWGRDPADPVISADMIAVTQAWLPAHTALTAREYDGIGHGINLEEMADVAAFLRGVA